jgi:hypothetical protein
MSLSKKEAYSKSVKDSFQNSKVLFWDVDVAALNFVDDYHYIINRVLNRMGVHPDALDVIDEVYSKRDIKWYCVNSEEIFSQESYKVLSRRYNINLKRFKRYWQNQQDLVHV